MTNRLRNKNVCPFQVWLGYNKKYLYNNDPDRYNSVDPGDLTRARMIKEKLNCKPFDYFLQNVMPDQEKIYPWQDYLYFARGVIQSEANSHFCIDSMHRDGKPLGIH